MNVLDKITSTAHECKGEGCSSLTAFYISSDDEPRKIVFALRRYFISMPALTEVKIFHEGRNIGCISKKAMSALFQQFFGESDAGEIPGRESYHIIELECPLHDKTLVAVSYNEDNPPQCPVHRLNMRPKHGH